MFYFVQSFKTREEIVDDFQEYLNTLKSTITYKQDFRPDVLIANTWVVKLDLNLIRDNKMVLMKLDFSAQIETQLYTREHHLDQ